MRSRHLSPTLQCDISLLFRYTHQQNPEFTILHQHVHTMQFTLSAFLSVFIFHCQALLVTFDDSINITLTRSDMLDPALKPIAYGSYVSNFFESITAFTGLNNTEVSDIFRTATWDNEHSTTVNINDLFNVSEADIAIIVEDAQQRALAKEILQPVQIPIGGN